MNLIARLFVLNFFGLALAVWAYMTGFVDMIVKADATHMTVVVAGLLVAGIGATFWHAFALMRTANVDRSVRNIAHIATRRRNSRKLAIRSAFLGDLVETVILISIVGNALGFLLGFSGIDKSSIATIDGLRESGGQILASLGSAFGSTVAGLMAAAWLMWNHRMLSTATSLYVEDVN